MANFGKLLAIMAAIAVPVVISPEANAQQSRNPNMGHFYMARQQWQVTNDAPVVKYQGGGGPPGSAQAPRGPAPLPRAGFTRFSQSMPQYRNNLPTVHNGVPKPMPARRTKTTRKKGNLGKTGKWKAPKKKVVKRKGPIKSKSYSPYKGYDPKGVRKPTATRGTAHAAARTQTKTKVKGSVLHWARGKKSR